MCFGRVVLYRSQANIDVRVMDGAFVNMRLFVGVALYTGCQMGFASKRHALHCTRGAEWDSHLKDTLWIEKLLGEFVRRVMRVAETRLCYF